MRTTAIVLAAALLTAGCGSESVAPTGSTTTIPTVVTGAVNDTGVGSEVFVPWHERATFAPLDQVPSDCFRAPEEEADEPVDPQDDIFLVDELEADVDQGHETEPSELLHHATSWLVLAGAPVVDDDGVSAAIEIDPDALTLHPAADFVPTHVATRDADIRRTLEWLAGRDDVDLLAILFVASDGFDLSPRAEQTHAEIAAGWAIIDREFVSLAGCPTVTFFAERLVDVDLDRSSDEAEYLAALEEITADRDSIFEAMGVGGNGFRFADCPAEDDPGLIPRLGFGGEQMAFAWGDLDARSTSRLDLSDWTVISSPDHSPALDIEAPIPTNWPNEDWFVTYDATDPSPRAVGLFGVDDDLGLYAATSINSAWESICDIGRDVLAFAEFLAGVEPDRERWDLPDGEEGDEQIIIDTLLALRDDPAAQGKFLEWTPCTYKLCVLTGGVPPRIG